jgi:4-azaleucine resistance transporter AzlC
MDLGASRRRLIQDSLGIMVSAGGFGLVYGLSARAAGFSPIEASAMSLFVFAGASQFVAVGYVLGGFSWVAVVLLTAFINARHFLYGAALAPYLADQPKPLRAAMAHVLTDEAFALAIAHFRRIGRADVRGYWLGAILSTFIPWNVATLVGVTIGGSILEPGRFGLDVIFPAAMGGLAVGLITGQRELVAALAGAVIAVAISVAWDPAAGIILGGVIGPFVGMAVPSAADDRVREGLLAFGPEPRDLADEPLIPFFPATIERLGRHPGDVAAADHGERRIEPADGSIEPDADRP